MFKQRLIQHLFFTQLFKLYTAENPKMWIFRQIGQSLHQPVTSERTFYILWINCKRVKMRCAPAASSHLHPKKWSRFDQSRFPSQLAGLALGSKVQIEHSGNIWWNSVSERVVEAGSGLIMVKRGGLTMNFDVLQIFATINQVGL